jgi:DNA-directed RNA polymerase subunit beta'
MAVHVPLSFEAQLEARLLMLSTNNLLYPSSGRPVTVPSQDMVIGCYYLTKLRPGVEGEGSVFYSEDEALAAHAAKQIHIDARIKVKINDSLLETSVGRVIFNEILPRELPYFNEVASRGKLEQLILDCYRKVGSTQTVIFLDKMKKLGFEYATLAGVTISIDDMLIPDEKEKLIDNAHKQVAKIQKRYERGVITNGERYNQVIDIWTKTTSEVAEVMFDNLASDRNGFNPIYMMADSGARGSKDQIRQLAGMRGLMAKPQKKITGGVGEIIESPIISNFREGLSVIEYFISTHGARKGLADTALKTADAGYLTRRLVDVAQDVIITEEDCNTILGIDITALKEGEEVIESLADRLLGRDALEDVFDPITDEIIVKAGEEINEESAVLIEEAGIDSVRIRSVLTCESKRGVCARCYGRNLAKIKPIDIGEAVGVIAAQSIGEPGTQLTLRTFHIGGTAARIAEQSKVEAKYTGKIEFKKVVHIYKPDGTMIVTGREGEIRIIDDQKRIRSRMKIPYGSALRVGDKTKIEKGETIFEWDPYSNTIVSEFAGKIRYEDIVPDVSLREELDETTGLIQPIIVEEREKTLFPTIIIKGQKGKSLGSYRIPTGAHLLVQEGQSIEPGEFLVKIPRQISRTRDITGGLPRVAELFEARKPHDPAVISEVDGIVEFGKIVRGQQQVFVQGDEGETTEYLIPHGRHLHIHNGDRVVAGESLCEGSIDPHDILKVSGVNAVQEYLVNEIQEVYRLQGVKINDKHIEVIVRQMLQKVRVEHGGDTSFLEGEQADRIKFATENERVIAEGGEPATFEPLLLGITKASLSTESFISAASFQETTKVLTEAAINGKIDYLRGLKENVIIGHLIPAGTGIEKYHSVELIPEDDENIDAETNESIINIFQENA